MLDIVTLQGQPGLTTVTLPPSVPVLTEQLLAFCLKNSTSSLPGDPFPL